MGGAQGVGPGGGGPPGPGGIGGIDSSVDGGKGHGKHQGLGFGHGKHDDGGAHAARFDFGGTASAPTGGSTDFGPGNAPLGGDPGASTSSNIVGGTTDPDQVNVGVDVSGAASSGQSAGEWSGSADIEGGSNSSVVRDTSRSVGDTQHKTDVSHVEAKMKTEMGNDPSSAMRGGTQEQHVMGLAREGDVYGKAEAQVGTGANEANLRSEARAQAFAEAGVSDPQQDLAKREGEIRGEAGKREGQYHQAEGKVEQGKAYAADPTGSAKTAAADAATSEARDQLRERVPVDPNQVQADVNVASRVVADPATAGEAKVEVAVDAEARNMTPKKPT
jgi:hypothetical protein